MFGTVGKLILCRLTYLNPPFIAFQQKKLRFLEGKSLFSPFFANLGHKMTMNDNGTAYIISYEHA